VSKKACKLVIGNMKAKVGNDVHRPITGKYGLHNETNDKGESLVNLASSRNVVGNTVFSHKDRHRWN
jgi:hypothetical protein